MTRAPLPRSESLLLTANKDATTRASAGVIDHAFEFAVCLLEGQRQYAENVVRPSAENRRNGSNDSGSGTEIGWQTTDRVWHLHAIL